MRTARPLRQLLFLVKPLDPTSVRLAQPLPKPASASRWWRSTSKASPANIQRWTSRRPMTGRTGLGLGGGFR